MATGLGYKTTVGFGTEADYGSRVVATKWIELNTGGDGLTVTEERLHSASVFGLSSGRDDMRKGAIAVAGDVAFDMRYGGMEMLLQAAMGNVVTTQMGGTASSEYMHVFKIQDTLGTDEKAFLSLEILKDITGFRAEGVMVNTMDLAITNTGFLICTLGLIGKEMGTGTCVSATFGTQPLVTFAEGALSWAGTSTPVSAAKIHLDNKLSTDRRFIGSRYISQPLRTGKIEVTGSFTAEFTGTELYNDFRDAQERALKLKFDGGAIGGGGTDNWTFEVNSANIRLTGGVPVVDNEGVIHLEAPFKAYSQGTGTREMEITLINETASI